MNESGPALDGVIEGFRSMSDQAVGYLPQIAMAILVLVFGWVLAKILRWLVVRAIIRLDLLWQRLIAKRGLVEHLPSRHPPVRVVGELFFWLVMLIFVTLATDILGLDVFGDWLKNIVTYLPLAVVGLLIVLVGFVVSSLVRDLVVSTAASTELSHGDLLGRLAQFIILFTAIVLGIDQIGIDITFLSVMAGIILTALLGGMALAFGLGARTHVSNIIAATQLRQIYRIGDRVRIGDIEGRVMDIMASRVIIDTETGVVDVPAKIFDEQVTSIIEKGV